MTAVGDTFRMPDGTTFAVQRPSAESSDGATLLASPPRRSLRRPTAKTASRCSRGTVSVMVDGSWRELDPGGTRRRAPEHDAHARQSQRQAGAREQRPPPGQS